MAQEVEGGEDVKDDPKSGRPSTRSTEEYLESSSQKVL